MCWLYKLYSIACKLKYKKWGEERNLNFSLYHLRTMTVKNFAQTWHYLNKLMFFLIHSRTNGNYWDAGEKFKLKIKIISRTKILIMATIQNIYIFFKSNVSLNFFYFASFKINKTNIRIN